MNVSHFHQAFAAVVGLEGGYSDHPADSGGPTKYGITEAVARLFGYAGAMRDLPLDTAKAIYRQRYWDLMRLDDVAALSPSVAHEIFDTGVNCGQVVAGTFLQRALNALNRQGSDYPDMKVDGLIGPMTVATLRAFMGRRGRDGEAVLLKALNALQGARYVELVERRAKDEAFLFGWLQNRVAIEA